MTTTYLSLIIHYRPVPPDSDPEPVPPLRRGHKSYRPEDIKRWGVRRILEEQAARGPFQMPDFGFTEEENRRMDEILAEERRAKDRATTMLTT